MVVIESSYMLCPLGDLQKEPGEHRIVTAEYPLQIEIGAGKSDAGVPEIGKWLRNTRYQLLDYHIALRAEAGGPADQVAIHLTGDVDVQPKDLRHSVDVKRAGDEDAGPRRVVPLAGDVAQPYLILRTHQADRHRSLYWAVREGQHGLQPGKGILPRLVRRVHQVLLKIVIGLVEIQKQAPDEDGVAIGVGKADRHRAVDQHISSGRSGIVVDEHSAGDSRHPSCVPALDYRYGVGTKTLYDTEFVLLQRGICVLRSTCDIGGRVDVVSITISPFSSNLKPNLAQ